MTEYRARKEDQTAPFTIRVECSGTQHIKEQLNDMLYDLRAFHSPGLLDTVSEDSNEYKLFERKSEVALSTIQSIFPDQDASRLEFLLDNEVRSVEEIQSALHHLADQITWPSGAETGIWEDTADDAGECRQKISQFMDEGLWPLIDKVE